MTARPRCYTALHGRRLCGYVCARSEEITACGGGIVDNTPRGPAVTP
jgi:hypothetical protein